MSRRNLTIIGILVLMGITSVVSILAYTFLIGGSGEPSAPISAPTLSLEDPTANPAEAQIAALSTQVAELQAQNATLVAEMANAADAALPTTETASVAAEPTVEAAAALFRIVPEESEVRFILTEDLRGTFNPVTGVTNQVAGDIAIDFANPANSRVGMIRINARTLTTDSEFRNRAIRAEILESSRDEYEFTEFTPTAISGLPATVAVGEPVTFQITGDLKVRAIVNAVTFDVTATVVSDERLEGTATALVTRAMYNLQIPNAPGVTNVSEEVTLEIDFVATQVES